MIRSPALGGGVSTGGAISCGTSCAAGREAPPSEEVKAISWGGEMKNLETGVSGVASSGTLLS